MSVNDERNSIKYIQNLHENCKERHYISDPQSDKTVGVRNLFRILRNTTQFTERVKRDFESRSGPA